MKCVLLGNGFPNRHRTGAHHGCEDGAPGRTRTSTDVNPPDFESGAPTNSATGACGSYRPAGARRLGNAREAGGIIDKIGVDARRGCDTAKTLSALQKRKPRKGLEAPRWQCRPPHVAVQQSDLNSSRFWIESMVKRSFTSFCYAKPILLL